MKVELHRNQIQIELNNPAFMAAFLQDVSLPLQLLLDYDGTLVGLEAEPSLAVLPLETYRLLKRLGNHPEIEVLIISGRDAEFLEAQCRELPLTLVAEHGAWLYRAEAQSWQNLITPVQSDWYSQTEAIMLEFGCNIPLSLIERKSCAIAWHYRRVAEPLQALVPELVSRLRQELSQDEVSILTGDKVIEVRLRGADKGQFVGQHLPALSGQHQPCLLAIGDDLTDEDMMAALPQEAITIKVGQAPSRARFRLEQQAEVLRLLRALAEGL